jgi:acyl dehydratase
MLTKFRSTEKLKLVQHTNRQHRRAATTAMTTQYIDISQPPAEWFEPREGFRFRPAAVAVSHDHQAGKLALCGLPADVFGEAVDPSFFIALGIRAGIANGISAQGNVNMLQRLVQHRPARLGEQLRVHGVIDRVANVPRGRTVHTDVWFEDEHGERVISAPRTSLKPDPNKTAHGGAGERPAAVIEDVAALRHLSTHTLTPEIVKGYSSEGNSIHYEMAAAKRAGFRAPLIGGGMGVHYLLSALWQHSPPQYLDLDIYFRRPIFWDDTFTVAVQPGGANWSAMALIRDGKVLTEACINELAAGATGVE